MRSSIWDVANTHTRILEARSVQLMIAANRLEELGADAGILRRAQTEADTELVARYMMQGRQSEVRQNLRQNVSHRDQGHRRLSVRGLA